MPIRKGWIHRLLFVFFLNFECVFCTLQTSPPGIKASGVTFCTVVHRRVDIGSACVNIGQPLLTYLFAYLLSGLKLSSIAQCVLDVKRITSPTLATSSTRRPWQVDCVAVVLDKGPLVCSSPAPPCCGRSVTGPSHVPTTHKTSVIASTTARSFTTHHSAVTSRDDSRINHSNVNFIQQLQLSSSSLSVTSWASR